MDGLIETLGLTEGEMDGLAEKLAQAPLAAKGEDSAYTDLKS